MVNDCIIGVCRGNEESCLKYHLHAGSGWDVTKS